MIALRGRNVNVLWKKALTTILCDGVEEQSRAGPVLVLPCPVMSVYDCPTERVLFDPARDANPTFHFFEALWMLAGRDDAAFLDKFVGDFGARFAEEDGTIHGAYGHRWREHFDIDQLNTVVDKLRANPTDRQAVITMWDPRPDTGPGGFLGANDLCGDWKDRPCNSHIYLRIRSRIVGQDRAATGVQSWLDMTVLCRSNDIFWGCYGANAVHFSFLQEYLAGRIGVQVGKLYQFSNNWHAYRDILSKYLDNADWCNNSSSAAARAAQVLNWSCDKYSPHAFVGGWLRPQVTTLPIGDKWEYWDTDLATFMSWAEEDEGNAYRPTPFYKNSWFNNTATLMFTAHVLWKRKQYAEAMEWAKTVRAPDWSKAVLEWMKRRRK